MVTCLSTYVYKYKDISIYVHIYTCICVCFVRFPEACTDITPQVPNPTTGFLEDLSGSCRAVGWW